MMGDEDNRLSEENGAENEVIDGGTDGVDVEEIVEPVVPEIKEGGTEEEPIELCESPNTNSLATFPIDNPKGLPVGVGTMGLVGADGAETPS